MADPRWQALQALDEIERQEHQRQKKLESDAEALANHVHKAMGMTTQEARAWVLGECEKRGITCLNEWSKR